MALNGVLLYVFIQLIPYVGLGICGEGHHHGVLGSSALAMRPYEAKEL
jgi:hypothetical protein